MKRAFPPGFIWGTSTAASQIETVFDHQWKGLKSRSGAIFDRTTDHELRRAEDLDIICATGKAYRLSLDWSKLQRSPMADFDDETVAEYTDWLQRLKDRGLHIMLVLHHFTEPNWMFEQKGWLNPDCKRYFLDYTEKMIHHFGHFADSWNTFNEPGGYMMMSQFMGVFPPYNKSIFKLLKMLKNMSTCHYEAYDLIKKHFPEAPIGISKHTMLYERDNALGWFTEKFINWLYLTYIPDHFNRKVDFVGISYYGRVPLDPMPVSEIDAPGKLERVGKEHDDMWEYCPQGIKVILRKFYKRYGKPIWITENGLCTHDDSFRVRSIRDYLTAIHECIEEGVEVQAYFHWTTWDNFEWFLGPDYRFGLYHVDFETMERTAKPSAAYYRQIWENNALDSQH